MTGRQRSPAVRELSHQCQKIPISFLMYNKRQSLWRVQGLSIHDFLQSLSDNIHLKARMQMWKKERAFFDRI